VAWLSIRRRGCSAEWRTASPEASWVLKQPVREKMNEWMANGAQVGWLIYPEWSETNSSAQSRKTNMTSLV
jgi:hypothetical protein